MMGIRTKCLSAYISIHTKLLVILFEISHIIESSYEHFLPFHDVDFTLINLMILCYVCPPVLKLYS